MPEESTRTNENKLATIERGSASESCEDMTLETCETVFGLAVFRAPTEEVSKGCQGQRMTKPKKTA